jgi:fructokinase
MASQASFSAQVNEAAPGPPARDIDVTCLGELMIDLVPEPSPDGDLRFVAKPGGAPGNVAVGVARLGLRSAMLSRVGQEAFGRLLLDTLDENGVDRSGVVEAANRSTGLAVVTLDPAGDRDFFFYRDTCADVDYAPGEVDEGVLSRSRVLSVGSLFLAREGSAGAQRHAIRRAKAQGILVAADPNFRRPLWKDGDAMRDAGREVVAAADIAKLSEDELALISGCGDLLDGARAVWHAGMRLLAVTQGPHGAVLFTRDDCVAIPGFAVETVDTVGCGDAFLAALLCGLLDGGTEGRERLVEVGLKACAAGALAATRAGGMASLPTGGEVERFLAVRGAA